MPGKYVWWETLFSFFCLFQHMSWPLQCWGYQGLKGLPSWPKTFQGSVSLAAKYVFFWENVNQVEIEMHLKLQVQVIHEPSHFYEQLLNRSVTAKKVEFIPLAQYYYYINSESSVLSYLHCILELGPRRLNLSQGFKATLHPTLIWGSTSFSIAVAAGRECSLFCVINLIVSRMVSGNSSCTLVSRLQEGLGGDRCKGHFYHTPKLRGALRWITMKHLKTEPNIQYIKTGAASAMEWNCGSTTL